MYGAGSPRINVSRRLLLLWLLSTLILSVSASSTTRSREHVVADHPHVNSKVEAIRQGQTEPTSALSNTTNFRDLAMARLTKMRFTIENFFIILYDGANNAAEQASYDRQVRSRTQCMGNVGLEGVESKHRFCMEISVQHPNDCVIAWDHEYRDKCAALIVDMPSDISNAECVECSFKIDSSKHPRRARYLDMLDYRMWKPRKVFIRSKVYININFVFGGKLVDPCDMTCGFYKQLEEESPDAVLKDKL